MIWRLTFKVLYEPTVIDETRPGLERAVVGLPYSFPAQVIKFCILGCCQKRAWDIRVVTRSGKTIGGLKNKQSVYKDVHCTSSHIFCPGPGKI